MNQPDRVRPVVTIVAACLATAMLMLDISVINTALSKIAHGLHTGLGGDVVDRSGRVAAFGKQAPGGGQDVAAGLVGHLLAAVDPRSRHA